MADAKLISQYCEHAVLSGDFEKKAYRPKGEDYEGYTTPHHTL